MTHTLMSDDEDGIKDGKIVTTEFISRPPVYRSAEVKQVLFNKLRYLLPDDYSSRHSMKRLTN